MWIRCIMMADNEEGADFHREDFDSFIICYVSIAMIFLTGASQDNLKMIYIQVSFFWQAY